MSVELYAKALDVIAGIIILVVTFVKWKQPKDSITVKELIKEIERKDREIERLILQHKAWQMRYEHKKKECEDKHLHS